MIDYRMVILAKDMIMIKYDKVHTYIYILYIYIIYIYICIYICVDCNYIGWVSYLQQTYPALDSHIGISVGPKGPNGIAVSRKGGCCLGRPHAPKQLPAPEWT